MSNKDTKHLIATYSGSDADLVGTWHTNLKSDVITITHDKLENVLLKYNKRHLLRTAWISPLSIIFSIVLTLTTSEFKQEALGIKQQEWHALFVITLIISVGFLFFTLIKLVLNWKETGIDFLMDTIKNVKNER